MTDTTKKHTFSPVVETNKALDHMWIIWRFVGIYGERKWSYVIYGVVVNLAASVTSPVLIFVNVFFLGDIGSIMHNLQASLTLIVSSLKQLVIFLKLRNFQQVKYYLDKLDKRANLNKDEVAHLNKVIRQCRLMAPAIGITILFSLFSYAASGLLKRKLIFEGWFPFDWSSSNELYILAFTFQFLAEAFQCVQNTANDVYPPIYLNLLNGHIRVLCMRVSRIGQDFRMSPEKNYDELKECIKDHKHIIGFFESIKPVIGLTVLMQLLITASILCMTAVYFLLFEREFSQLINAITYILAILFAGFPVCFFGNALMAESENLTAAIYNCNWVDQSLKFRKDIIVFLQRSQRTNVILAGGLVSITLQTYVDIIKFSVSMFTVLSEMQ